MNSWPRASSIHFFTVTHNQNKSRQIPGKFSVIAVSLSRELLRLGVILMLCGQFTPALGARASRLPDGPEVVMESTKRDFGDVFAGEELEQNFPVRNVGNKPLELERRSTLGSRPNAAGYSVTAAVWHPNNVLRARVVAARPAAPS